jgi:hypothetical protein
LLEYLIRSSHIGWATSSISSSLSSIMFTRLFYAASSSSLTR